MFGCPLVIERERKGGEGWDREQDLLQNLMPAFSNHRLIPQRIEDETFRVPRKRYEQRRSHIPRLEKRHFQANWR
jgi:hypothetical protein